MESIDLEDGSCSHPYITNGTLKDDTTGNCNSTMRKFLLQMRSSTDCSVNARMAFSSVVGLQRTRDVQAYQQLYRALCRDVPTMSNIPAVSPTTEISSRQVLPGCRFEGLVRQCRVMKRV